MNTINKKARNLFALLLLLLQPYGAAMACQSTSHHGQEVKKNATADKSQSNIPQADKRTEPIKPSTAEKSKVSRPNSAVAPTIGGAAAASGNLIETMMKLGNYTTFISLVEVAGLTEKLKGVGPFTVFVPTDVAFAKLPVGTLDELKKPENQEKLRALIEHHIVQGRFMTADLGKISGKNIKPLGGGELSVSTPDDLRIDGVVVTQTDIAASNGVIDEVGGVLLIPSVAVPVKVTKKE